MLAVKNPSGKSGDVGQSLGQENPLEEGMAIQYSCLENSMDREAWQAIIHRVTKSQTQLND